MILDNLKSGSATIDALLSQTTQGIQGGQTLGTSLSGVASGLISPYTSILNVVGLGGAFQKTFGNILSNGFNLSCWGSSKDPAKIKSILQTNYVPYFNTLLTNLQMGDVVSVNRFIKDVYVTHSIAVVMQTATKWDSCSRKGLALYLEFLNPLKAKADALVSEFVKTGAKNNVQKMPRHISLSSYVPEGSDLKQLIDVPVLTYSVSSVKTKVGVKDLKNHMVDITKPLTKEPTFDGGELNEVIVKQKKSDGFPWWVLALGLGMM